MSAEPLEGLDGAFLALETKTSHLHVAAVLLLEAPEGRRSLFSSTTRFSQIRRLVAERIHLVPPMRRRALNIPLGICHPLWVDDPDFDLDDHLHRSSVPEPGGRAELDDLVGDIMSRPLDPDRPLWEMVVVEGLAEGRAALVAKFHHAILDGVAGASLMGAFFDLGPRDRKGVPLGEPWQPEPLPGATELLRYAATSLARQPVAAKAAIEGVVEAVAEVGTRNRALAAEGRVPPPAPFSAPRTSINGVISGRRRFATTSLPLEDAKLIRRVFGTTLNDVVLAGAAGGLLRLLARRGESPDRPLVALVPASTRTVDELGALGNRVSGMLVSLATTIDDPVGRLMAIAESSRRAKAQERALGGRLLGDVARITPPAVASRAARWATGLGLFERLPPPYTLTVSSVPGPDFPLWCAGSRVAALHPVGPVAGGAAVNVTAMSYLGDVHFGILACRRLVPEVRELAVMLDDALGELMVRALDARGAAG